MGRLTKLKLEVLKMGLTQRQLGILARMDESQVSLIASGRLVPSAIQKEKISKAMGKPESALFESR